MRAELFAEDYAERPLWLDDAPPPPEAAPRLPEAADVVVIGGGYTGLCAALQTARAGRSTLVLEAGDLGTGCSSRNGGQISTSIKPSEDRLASRHGRERARAIRQVGVAALDWIGEFVAEEAIDCDFARGGRFHGAHTPGEYDAMARAIETPEPGREGFAAPRGEQRAEIGSDFYHGGVVFTRHAALHPAKLHRGLMARAVEAGAMLVPHCPALALTREARGFMVETPRGRVRARDVVVATNGYTGALVPWLTRRVIPIGSYIIATEALPAETMDRLFPTNRIVTDSRRVVFYFRPSPDRRRVVFGGRVSATESDPRVTGPKLHAEMIRIFPELAETRISHSWFGKVAFSFDELAHSGVHDGVHYAMCYCGSGVSMACYLGARLGQRLLGEAEGRTAFDDLPFPTRPLYSGSPWFLPPLVAWYRWRDRFDGWRAGLGA